MKTIMRIRNRIRMRLRMRMRMRMEILRIKQKSEIVITQIAHRNDTRAYPHFSFSFLHVQLNTIK